MTRKGSGTTAPHPRSESDEERREHGPEAHREGRLPKGEDARRGVDWMDFDEPDGGDDRSAVHLGERRLESEREDEPQG